MPIRFAWSLWCCAEGEEALERRNEKLLPQDLSKENRAQLVEMVDRVERIVTSSEDPNEGDLLGTVSESQLELEVLRLRRDLAAVKLETAALAGKRDETRHTVAELHKQLLGEANLKRKNNRGASLLFQ